MKMLRYVILMSCVVLLLAGCGGLPPVFPDAAGPTAAVQPTVEPTVAAPAEPLATEVAPATAVAPAEQAVTPPAATEVAPVEAPATPGAEPVMGENPLAGTVWEWAALIKTRPAMQSVVPDPSSYTAVFGPNGEMLIKADCNNGRATYTLDNDLLTITLGAVTRAACPPGSLSDEFLTNLSKVGSYQLDGDDLILGIADTNDSMIFRNGGPAITEAPAGAPAEAETPTLVGPTWQWVSFLDVATGKDTFDVEAPENYTVTFAEDGSAAMQADCNRAVGTYTVDGAALSVEVGPVTLAACEPDSRGAQFLVNLTSAGTYLFADGQLVIDLQADGGRMVFDAAK